MSWPTEQHAEQEAQHLDGLRVSLETAQAAIQSAEQARAELVSWVRVAQQFANDAREQRARAVAAEDELTQARAKAEGYRVMWDRDSAALGKVISKCREQKTMIEDQRAQIAQVVADSVALRAALEKIGGFRLSEFMGPHAMALECTYVARDAIGFTNARSAGVRAASSEPVPNNPGECTECHARAGSVCSDVDCPGRHCQSGGRP